jgi:glycyl-tRNA synthetase
VAPFTWANVTSGHTSRGPRFADAAAKLPVGGFTTFPVAEAEAYFDAVAAEGIVVDRSERRQLVAEAVAAAAAAVGCETTDEPALLDEVTELIEAPQALLGTFEAHYLELPAPVLIGVMKKHQRYFPVVKNGKLVNHFVAVANSNELAHPDVVREGYEGVIRARYADAAYFYRHDSGRSLESFTPRLGTLTFHAKLGSMLDRVERLKQLAPQVAEMLGATPEQVAATRRAAELSKSDLVTNMVVEMTSLQGIMGEIYAVRGGESSAVGQAIREQYLPRFTGDDVPLSLPGLALSLADKLDSLAGLFAVRAIPTGSADPFGLRRAALGIVNSLLAAKVDFSVRAGLHAAARLQPVAVSDEVLAETAAFVERRFEGVLDELGYAYDVVAAALAARSDNPNATVRAANAVAAAVAQGGWSDVFTAYARCVRITRSLPEQLALNPQAYAEEVEKQLHQAYSEAAAAMQGAEEPAQMLWPVLEGLRHPINAYFEKVLVNAEDQTLRNARLALVQAIALLPAGVADLSKLQGF